MNTSSAYLVGNNNYNNIQFNPSWYLNKVEEFQPHSTLRSISTIEWLRKRKSSCTNEKYLHTGEELKQKEMIQKIVKKIHQCKPLNQNISLGMEDIQTIQKSQRFQRQDSRRQRIIALGGNMTMSHFSQSGRAGGLNNTSLTVQKSPFNKKHHQNYSLSISNTPRINNNFDKCVYATIKTVEVSPEALQASREIETKVQRFQRKQIQKRIHYPKNERDARKCVREFVELFKTDCDGALQETNEFYQMKKIELKSNLSKVPRVDGISQTGKNQNSNKFDKEFTFDKLSQLTIKHHTPTANIIAAGQPINKILDDYQCQLKFNKDPKEVQYLQKIETIIQSAKSNINVKFKKNTNTSSAIVVTAEDVDQKDSI